MNEMISPPTEQKRPEPAQPDLSGYLEQRKRDLRSQFQVRHLTDEEREIIADMDWAAQDPEVQIKYQGEFVIPWRRTIIAHGHDAASVLAEAARVTGQRVQDLPLVGIVDPLLEIPH